jgi:hypothetical protein
MHCCKTGAHSKTHLLFYYQLYLTLRGSVADPLHFDADPDPTFHFDADPDPAFLLVADPDPAFHFDADPDTASQNDADPCVSRLQHCSERLQTFKRF